MYDKGIVIFISSTFILLPIVNLLENPFEVQRDQNLENFLALKPLFYFEGNSSLIREATKYEIEKIKLFSNFVSMNQSQRETLDKFLSAYNKTMEDIILCSNLEHKIRSAPSYELALRIEEQYRKILRDYELMISYLLDLSGFMEDYPDDLVVREKYGYKITVYDIKREVELCMENKDSIAKEIERRSEILHKNDVAKRLILEQFILLLMVISVVIYVFRRYRS
ncbi:MAG: hypothetical protein ACE5K4_05600 [Candidatus Hydrothermarchaeota archaeon]